MSSAGFAPITAPVLRRSRSPSCLPFSSCFHSTRSLLYPSLTVRHFAPNTKHFRYPRSNIAPPESPIPCRIAVVGGGLAGLAVTYHLLNSTARFARKRNFDHTNIQITLFDPNPPGTAGASAAAAGLLHTFRPRPKTKMWNHQKAIDAAIHLLAVAQTAAPPPRRLYSSPGLLKLALDDRSEQDFQIAVNRFPSEVELLQPHEISKRFANVQTSHPALYIRPAHVVDTVSYMQALWSLCQQSGRVTWTQQSVSSVSQLFDASFDNVILCSGAQVKQISDLSPVPLKPCLGQNVLLQSTAPAPSVPLLSGLYVVPSVNTPPGTSSLIAGPTFEYDFIQPLSDTPDVDAIIRSFQPKMDSIVPSLFNEWTVSGTQAGIRAIPPRTHLGSIPIVCKVAGTPPQSACWVLTGLGGRGLLYHAFLARRLAHAVVAGTDKHIPGDARHVQVEFSPCTT